MVNHKLSEYAWDTKPAKLQTEHGWIDKGWQVFEPVPGIPPPVKGLVKGLHSNKWHPLYEYAQVHPIPGAKALQRRIEFMLVYLDGIARRQGSEWVNGHALVALITDEMIQDAAMNNPPVDEVFFRDQLPTIPEKQRNDRRMWAFEEAALKALDRDFSSYAYNPF